MKDKNPGLKDVVYVLHEQVARLKTKVIELEARLDEHEMKQATIEGGENQQETSKRLRLCIGGTLLAAALQYIVNNLPPF
jgi:phage shock protein A